MRAKIRNFRIFFIPFLKRTYEISHLKKSPDFQSNTQVRPIVEGHISPDNRLQTIDCRRGVIKNAVKIKAADRRDKPAALPARKKVRYIPLTQGHFAVIDSEDYFRVSQYNWRCSLDGNTYYAYAFRRVKGRKRRIFMHRLILNAPKHKLVDHIDGNGLNNRKANLRLCNHKQNGWNRRPNSSGYSKYKGVTWHKGSKKWDAAIRKSYKRTHLGYFDSEIEAARAYDKKAKELFGEFAYLNFGKTRTDTDGNTD